MSTDDGVLTEPVQGGMSERPNESSGLTLPPLTVSALMVRKADLIAALRVYLPQLADIEMIDPERFLLTVGAPDDQNGAA